MQSSSQKLRIQLLDACSPLLQVKAWLIGSQLYSTFRIECCDARKHKQYLHQKNKTNKGRTWSKKRKLLH